MKHLFGSHANNLHPVKETKPLEWYELGPLCVVRIEYEVFTEEGLTLTCVTWAIGTSFADAVDRWDKATKHDGNYSAKVLFEPKPKDVFHVIPNRIRLLCGTR